LITLCIDIHFLPTGLEDSLWTWTVVSGKFQFIILPSQEKGKARAEPAQRSRNEPMEHGRKESVGHVRDKLLECRSKESAGHNRNKPAKRSRKKSVGRNRDESAGRSTKESVGHISDELGRSKSNPKDKDFGGRNCSKDITKRVRGQ